MEMTMDFAASSISAQAAPTFVADTRPSADVAASKTTREPALAFAPTGMAPNTSQAATVSRSLLLATGVEEPQKPGAVSAISAVERTLKPYGTPMLPQQIEAEGDEKNSSPAAQEPVDSFPT
jgi:hypothetical protein